VFGVFWALQHQRVGLRVAELFCCAFRRDYP
jgi:hypothetical protein